MIKKIDNKTRKEMDKLIYACVSAGIRTFQSNVKCDKNITLEEFLTSVLINRIGIGTGTVLNITDEIKKINFLMNPNSNVTSIEFGYDAMGNRISKKVNVLSAASPTTEYTYYMREANGNVMAVYENDGPPNQLDKLCFKIKFYCENIDDFVEREICTDDFYLNSGTKKYHISSSLNPILDCDGNEILFTEIQVGLYDNRFDIFVPPTTVLPLIYSYYDFTMTFNGNTGLNLAEWHIWGSGSEGRVGIRRPERDKLHYFDDYINYPFPTNNFSRYIRYKDYELKDHLGNVRATITDLKLKDGARYKVDLSSANTYYPFGMLMPERNWSSEWYRYGFQGQEKDDELKGSGNSLDFGARIYDSRLGKFLSIDPKSSSFPFWSPYLFAANNPIRNIDILGEGPGDKVKIKNVISNFDTDIEGNTYKVTVYADQPGDGGDRDTWEGLPTDPDVGHTFIKLTQLNKDGSQIERIVGFYPNSSVNLDNPEIKGTFRDDNGHNYDVSIEYKVDKVNFQNTLDYLKGLDGKKYNLNTQNCTDIGLGCAEASGNPLPDTKGEWGGQNILGYEIPKGGGSNPGDLGQDIRGAKGANTKKGIAKTVNKNKSGEEESSTTQSTSPDSRSSGKFQ